MINTLLLLLLSSPVAAQVVTLDSVHREFERYTIGPGDQGVHFEPPESSLLGSFYKNNQRLIEYIGFNYWSLKDEYLYWHKSDSSRFGNVLADTQWRNLVFERLVQIMDRYLIAKQGLHIEGVTLKPKPKLSVLLLQSHAAKFFYPDSIMPDGGTRTHICIGFNGFRDAASPRNLMLEAFAYSVVNEHIMIENDPITEDFDSAITTADFLSLSDDRTLKLYRTQGVVWGIMSQSPFLEAAIRDMYEKEKAWLPFEMI